MPVSGTQEYGNTAALQSLEPTQVHEDIVLARPKQVYGRYLSNLM